MSTWHALRYPLRPGTEQEAAELFCQARLTDLAISDENGRRADVQRLTSTIVMKRIVDNRPYPTAPPAAGTRYRGLTTQMHWFGMASPAQRKASASAHGGSRAFADELAQV